MKTVYTVPKLSSLNDNGIKDLLYVSDYLPQLRLVYLEGVPVRIELNKDDYVELNSEEEHVDISAYNDILKKLLEYFYGTCYLYGFVNNGKLTIYDVYTNDNYLSTRDLLFLEASFGIPVVKPITEGNFSSAFLIEVLNKKINSEGMHANNFFLLPSVYVDDNRELSSIQSDLVSTVIIGEKKTYPAWNSYNYGNYNYGNYNQGTTTTAQATTQTTKKEEKRDKIFTEIFTLSTKAERQKIFDETFSNVSGYYESIKDTLTDKQKEWWKNNSKSFIYLYSLHTLPATRQIVYDYCACYALEYCEYAKPIEMKWSLLFIDMFDEYFEEFFKGKKIKIDLDTYDMFALFFKEELIEFDKFFVKETDKKEDWRYGENTTLVGGLC